MLSCLPADEVHPAWFVEALRNPGSDRTTAVAGAMIHYHVWGHEGAPVIVLVHGGAAHGGWWDHVAPLLAGEHRVVAIDLSGHGSSDSRTAYDFETWADEIVGVAEVEGSEDFVVVGHSMGGVATLVAAHRHASRLRGAIVVDLPDWVLRGRVPPALSDLPPRRYHPDRRQAEERFRARPADAARLPFVERHIARRSVRRTDAGWSWRFDHAVTTHGSIPDEIWGLDHCAVVLIAAERGMMEPSDHAVLAAQLHGAPVVTIRDSGHHIMLDQPLALTAAIASVVAGWKR